ncbi:MAG: hypothetical protein LBV27_02045, partial [Oscillospiraceae bacterium]|nr:hypothetical protein [Oscillospiraceae bacterium]
MSGLSRIGKITAVLLTPDISFIHLRRIHFITQKEVSDYTPQLGLIHDYMANLTNNEYDLMV